MSKVDTAVNPKPIISLMYAISVGFWAKELASYMNEILQPVDDIFDIGAKNWVALASGCLFLVDLLCIVWWYARYIYRIQPVASFWMYFLDFVICSMFALAANSWTKPSTFLFATVLATFFLVIRFLRLYMSTDASLTDRLIMRTAGGFLIAAFSVAIFCLFILGHLQGDPQSGDPESDNGSSWLKTLDPYAEGHMLPGVLALIGIALTWFSRKRIDVAVDIYSATHEIKSAAPLWWPRNGIPSPEQRILMRQEVRAGLDDFNEMFQRLGRHDRVRSRVHAEEDLRIQSYVLAVPSCSHTEFADEMRKKAFMVAVSHWLDDLVDGRNEDTVCRRLLDGPRLSGEFEHAKELFLHIYRPLIIKYTDKKFFGHLSERIDDACLAPFNRGSMLLGLNRVAYGAVLFSPRIAPDRRRDLLRDHNVFLKEWNVEGEQFTNEVEAIVDEMSAGEEAGSLLLGLTTKTVQEIAMASENYQMNIGLSLLFSILYAPLIYYHNVIEEVRQNEMILLQAFDTDYDLWVPWLERTRTAIDMLAGEKYSEDLARAVPRRSQMAMAYHCFEKMLPPVIDEHIRDIYVREPKKE